MIYESSLRHGKGPNRFFHRIACLCGQVHHGILTGPALRISKDVLPDLQYKKVKWTTERESLPVAAALTAAA